MQIVELHAPTDGGTLYCGLAESNRGRRYKFMASAERRTRPSVFRENERGFWARVPTPRALSLAVRRAIRSSRGTHSLG